MPAQAKVLTLRELFGGGGGGGGFDPRDHGGSFLGAPVRLWASRILAKKQAAFDAAGAGSLTPAEFTAANRLQVEFSRVSWSTSDAWRIIRRHSRVFDNPVARLVLN